MLKIKIFIPIILIIFSLTSCGKGFFKPGDARKNPPDPKLRVKKNLEEGKGFRLNNAMSGNQGTNFEFASSNELWRASLDVLDFMPLTSANYSGGVIITDWYSEQNNDNESIKITIRFLSNEIRSDAIDVNIFYKKCISTNNCKVNKQDGQLKKEITKKILAKATIYKKQSKDKNFKPYIMSTPGE
ncbi:DUF3576 domain-containing protein [Candidatus Pelagibacter sp.]|uniref:DUF3576 domain-containing protein n=1 Tax=Candidatus Pelagibacter sp. TaxID=2024849 RepID=UPI003F846EC0